MDAELLAGARAWLQTDPDADDRAELARLIDADDEAAVALRFGPPLRFGTAGIRGPLRAGPSGMNTVTVARTAAGLAAFLPAGADVLVGYDGRHRSRAFADTVGQVLVGAGCSVRLLGEPVPTPLLAFGVRHLDADAGVMITASHNPGTDNGLKVYLGGPAGDPATGAQIAAPVDARIEEAISRVGCADELPRGAPHVLDVPSLAEPYLAAIVDGGEEAAPGPLRIAYTPMHGVGLPLILQALRRSGFSDVRVVPGQAEPDPDFPSLPYPNPEVPGALDQLLALVGRDGADLGLASDPDADRCAAVIGTRVLTGDEIGCLLADAVLRRSPGPVATTLVSSTLLPKMAARADVPCHVTSTGFKNLMRSDAALVFAYEEAIGFAVAPDVVRDKDGVGAAVLLARLARELARTGRSPLDRLDELMVEFGLHVTRGMSVRLDDAEQARGRSRSLHLAPPARLGASPVLAVERLEVDGSVLAPEEGALLRLDDGRVIVRPSGTEPTLKAYLEVVRPVHTTAADARRQLQPLVEDLGRAVGALLRPEAQPSN